MFRWKTRFKPILHSLAAILLFATVGAAQITGLCNTGQTVKTALGCTGVLEPPNPTGGGPNRDGTWRLAYPYPTPLQGVHGPCGLKTFIPAWVDTPEGAWLPNYASTASEWITPYDGESVNGLPPGWYVYATSFPVPSVLPGGGVPTGVMVNGRVASDNATYTIYLESPAGSRNCSLVSGQQFPVNQVNQFSAWTLFSFKNRSALTAGAGSNLYFVVQNSSANPTPTGFRAEFFDSSTFIGK